MLIVLFSFVFCVFSNALNFKKVSSFKGDIEVSIFGDKVFVAHEKGISCFENEIKMWEKKKNNSIVPKISCDDKILVFIDQKCELKILDSSNGNKINSKEIDSMVRVKPVIKDDKIFFPTVKQSFYCFYRDGGLLWINRDSMNDHPFFINLPILVDKYVGVFIWGFFKVLDKRSGVVLKSIKGILPEVFPQNIILSHDERKIFVASSTCSFSIDKISFEVNKYKNSKVINSSGVIYDENNKKIINYKEEITCDIKFFKSFGEYVFGICEKELLILKGNKIKREKLDFKTKNMWCENGKIAIFDGNNLLISDFEA